MEKEIPCNGILKRKGVVIFVSDKTDLKSKTLTKDKEGHYIMIKESIHQKDITIEVYMHPTLEHLNI